MTLAAKGEGSVRLKKEMVDHLSRVLVAELIDKGCVRPKIDRQKLAARISHIITEDLLIEDKLNEEVREVLRAHSEEFERGNVDYSKMFNLVKNKLVKERGLIL